MIGRASTLVAAGVIAVASLHAAPVRGGAMPLKRSVENMLQGPLDVALTPVVAATTTYRNLGAEEHTAVGKVGLGLLTYTGFLFYDSLAACFRTWAGALEFPVAIGALAATPFTEWSPPEIFSLEGTPALVDYPTKAFDVKFGVYHVGGSRE